MILVEAGNIIGWAQGIDGYLVDTFSTESLRVFATNVGVCDVVLLLVLVLACRAVA